MDEPFAWLVDTNVVSEMMRPKPNPRVCAFLDSATDEGLGISVVTVWEILNGFGRLDHGRRRKELSGRFHGLVEEFFEGRIIAWTFSDARECARIMEEKRRLGESLDDHCQDAFIAASASSRGLSVITRNTAEFRNTGVKAVNPWEGG